MSCFIIAEAGVNHNGDINLAKELIHAAKETGANAVKFQTFKADSLVNKTAEQAQYQKRNSVHSTQYDMLKALEISEDDHCILVELADSLGIEFMSTAFDEESVDFLISLGVRRLKIPSGEITNLPFLEYLAKTSLPLIMSTGMSDLREVKAAVDTIQPFYGAELKNKLTLLHCTSNYPAAYRDVNLKAMQTLANEFSLPVGYSDHTLGILVPLMATAMGAKIIEKHFTLDQSLPGPDHAASMVPEEFLKMVKEIRDAESALGEGLKQPTQNELPIRDLVRRSVALKYELPQGTRLTKDDLILLRPGTGINPAKLHEVIGKRLTVNLNAGSTLQWEHIEA
ncbi:MULTISPECIES: N-acetylneuraminate synthase [unclassified Legionella]|uniref:N-acetylneuraminate synthase n=1 Tax=unclassified Legionella TaxID=2622702 RepID=UPI0010548FFD|nr:MULTISPECIES: N-acetylneuraminate synthase [unclassified Legionella]MDI9817744.1 N-acetylneuraminate synthase [Legionella sp. PL877]